MAMPSERSMPIVTATWSELHKAWIVELPGVDMYVPQAADVPALVAKHACGSSIRFVNPSAPIRPHTAARAGGV